MKELLKALSPYVIVTGSYAEGTQTNYSDIDFYIKQKPEDEYNPEDPNSEEHYVKEVKTILKKYGIETGSVFIGSMHTENLSLPLEFSIFYEIDADNIFKIEILGVEFLAAKSLYERKKK